MNGSYLDDYCNLTLFFSGMTSEEACDEFLRVASDLDTYGFDPYSVKVRE